NSFIPDYGRITTYRSAGGFAVRLDGGNGFGGAVITPYFDSLLVKLTTWGSSMHEAAKRMDRCLRESRIRGVKTNIPFLENLVLQLAEAVARSCPGLVSLEQCGGATVDASMRFRQESPWDRRDQLRARIPNVPFHMLLRASNAVGYTSYPDNVVKEFTKIAAA